MKKNYSILMAVFVVIFGFQQVNAQCALSSSYWGEMVPSSGATFVSYAPYGPGMYFRIPVLNGASYTVSTCGNSMDTQLTGYQGTSPQIFYNDDNGPICTGTAASATHVPNFTDYMRVQVSQYNCLPGGSASITVQVRQNNNLTFTSASTDMCAGDVRTLTATPAPVGSAMPNSGDLGTFSGTGVSGATFTAPTPAGASATYSLTYTFGYCSTTQDITVFNAPSTADAGLDQPEVCGTSTTLQGNTPAIGTGTWSVVSGTGTLSNPNDPNSTITGLIPGSTVTLSWTITNGPCSASSDNVTLIVGDNTAPLADIATLADVTSECEVTSLTAPTATDNCAGSISGTHNATLPITTQGTTVVTWTYDDGNGNTTTQMQNVVIADVTAPVADSLSLVDMIECNSAMPVVPTATDNCAGQLTGTPDVTLPITTPGLTVVTWTFDDGNGNTSTQTQNITINTVDVSVTQSGPTLTANSVTGNYQWLDCDNNYQMIAGATSASYTPMAITGNYAVQVTNNGCVDTSSCYTVDYTGVEEIVNGLNVNIYPNPSSGKFDVKISGGNIDTYTVSISDLAGRVISLNELNTSNDSKIEFDITDKPAGIYVLNISSGGNSVYNTRIIKQ